MMITAGRRSTFTHTKSRAFLPTIGSCGHRLLSRGGLELDLDPTRLALIEGHIGVDGGDHRLALRENLRWIQHTAADQPHQMRNVAAMITVAHHEREVLFHSLTDGEGIDFAIHADD